MFLSLSTLKDAASLESIYFQLRRFEIEPFFSKEIQVALPNTTMDGNGEPPLFSQENH